MGLLFSAGRLLGRIHIAIDCKECWPQLQCVSLSGVGPRYVSRGSHYRVLWPGASVAGSGERLHGAWLLLLPQWPGRARGWNISC